METLKKLFNNFKKHSKIYIAFAMIITCVFGLMFVTNTFAYESSNDITDTLDLTTITGGNYTQNTLIKEYTGLNNETYKCIEINHSTTESIYMSFGINLKSDLNYNSSSGNFTYLINFEYGYYSNSVWTTFINTSSSSYLTTNFGNNAGATNYQQQVRNTYFSISEYGYNYKTAIKQIYQQNATINYSNMLYFNFRLPAFVSTTNYAIRIYNIDIVPNIDLYTKDYIDTYYGPIEEQYNDLLEDYNTLQDNYDTLQDNYTDLESNYNDLQDDYTTLENNYNDLQANGINNLYGGLYASLNGSIAKLYNVDNPTLNYLLTLTPYATTTLQVDNFSVGPGELGLIVENDNNHDLVNRCLILYTLHNPMLFNSLTFTRVENNQSRYIYLYFNDNTSETITIYDSGDYETKSVTWFNNSNKYLTHIITDCEPGYDVVHTISNSSDGQAYENGYDKGYAVGYNDHQSSITQAYNDLKDKYSNAYDNGYNAGFEAADRSEFASSGMNNLFNAILSYPVNFIKQVFNFEFMGVNVSAIITFIISIGIVAFIINYFRKH